MLPCNAARSFVVIMIVIALSAFCLRITIEQVMRMTIERNESDASAALKLISTALENYAKDNKGAFPQSLKSLVKTSPAYLKRNYISQSAIKGYSYTCPRLELDGYTCSAVPTRCGLTGKKVFTITTGESLTIDECKKKE